MDLRRFDLNLLLAFDALMRERNVSKAAKRLFVSQSAMSHSLRRLREGLGDALLVPTKGGMQATPRAMELEPRVRGLLLDIEYTLSTPIAFDPSRSQQRFVLGSTDYVEYVFLPPLINHLSHVAPGVDIVLKRFDHRETDLHLAEGDIDVAIDLQQREVASGVESSLIANDHPVALLRVDHSQIENELSLERYASLPHVVVDSMELSEEIDSVLAREGLSRRVQLRSPNFLSAPQMLATTNMVTALPSHIARCFTRGGRLQVKPLPIEVGVFPINLYWHRILNDDPAQQWFRQQLLNIGGQLLEGELASVQ